MRVLALDTTTRAGSAAVLDDGRVVAERGGDPSRTHAERLPAELVELLTATGLKISDVDLFAVASGPGSFTGLRIGIATIQGMALVSRRPIVPVSALEALAQLGSRDLRPGDLVAAWMDAHRREVFSALYRVGKGELFRHDRLIQIEGSAVGPPAVTIERWRAHLSGATLSVIGDGEMMFSDLVTHGSGVAGRVLGLPRLAGAIGRIALDKWEAGHAVGPDRIQPLYVRRPDAEVAREEKREH